MHTQVKIRNLSTGPLSIMDTWGPQVERKIARSVWKKGEDGLVKTHKLDVRQVPPAFNLMPGEEAILPRAAANSDQIVGLHRAGMISVSPVAVEDAPKAPAKADRGQDTPPAGDGQEEASKDSQDADGGKAESTGKDRKGKGKGKGKGKAGD